MQTDQLLVADYIARKGQPRRFETDVRCSFDWARDYLAKHKIHIQIQANKCRVVRDGQRKLMSWQQVLKIVDEVRVAEGLEPLQVRQ